MSTSSGPPGCRPEHCGAAEILRLLPADFTGKVELHVGHGIIATVRVIQHHDRQKLIALAGKLRTTPDAAHGCLGCKAERKAEG